MTCSLFVKKKYQRAMSTACTRQSLKTGDMHVEELISVMDIVGLLGLLPHSGIELAEDEGLLAISLILNVLFGFFSKFGSSKHTVPLVGTGNSDADLILVALVSDIAYDGNLGILRREREHDGDSTLDGGCLVNADLDVDVFTEWMIFLLSHFKMVNINEIKDLIYDLGHFVVLSQFLEVVFESI
jgi:hypothetical protein